MVCNCSLQIPAISEDQLQTYLNMFQAELSKKTEDMYNGRFLRSIRFSTQGSDFFITARVSAEMKKDCVYTVDLHLHACGVLQAVQCECAVGMGPGAHFKHVCLALSTAKRHCYQRDMHAGTTNIPYCQAVQ
jgi:hypothetical protein